MKNRQTFIPTEKCGFLTGLTVFFVFTFMFLHNGNLSAASVRDVVINEIAWMGTAASTYDEWIELYNNTGSTVSLTNWTLEAADGTPSITLSGSIAPYGYFLLERTDNNTVSDITADQIYSGSTENGGEDFQLKDSSDTLIDQVDCSSGWFAGDNTNKITMERINPEIDGSTSTNWANNDEATTNGLDANSNPLKGTARALNSVYDDIAPSEINDLAAFPGIGEGEINLSWTATGDDGTIGAASSYVIRYNTVEISTTNWASSTAVTQSWAPQVSTSIEWHTVTGLTAGTTYYFAIKAKDEVGNTSDISNSPSATGQYSDAVVFNEVAPSETGGGDIIEIYVKKEANCANAKIYENANAQGAELIKELPASGDWAGSLPAGTYIILRVDNTSSDETDIGVDGVINVYSTDSGLTATDNLLFIGNIEGIAFSGGAYQSGEIIDFIAWANQDDTD
ncbi:MAG: lamin tail domain-containing protein, partial [Elusimicrobiota bacterium]|nr:lamin tail domain-containing protein [Elusimicrobiota bacterium]